MSFCPECNARWGYSGSDKVGTCPKCLENPRRNILKQIKEAISDIASSAEIPVLILNHFTVEDEAAAELVLQGISPYTRKPFLVDVVYKQEIVQPTDITMITPGNEPLKLRSTETVMKKYVRILQ